MKKGGNQKGLPVKDDEKYLEGINLVTGDKIDYARHILTQTQINALCVSEKISKVDKFVRIMTHGQKIQKWSMFENITLYVENVEAAEKIFSLIEKNYAEYEEFISIMGEGFSNYLHKCTQFPHLISNKVYDSVYRIMLRTLTSHKFQGSELLLDWMVALTSFFRIPAEFQVAKNRKEKLSELNDFINGSFSMNTLPERRKTALEMINALVGVTHQLTNQESQQIQSQSHSKILFFNNDLNPSTRLIICNIIEQILLKNSSPEIWKCVTDYFFTDKSLLVKDKAFEIISKIYFKPNAEHIFHEFDGEKSSSFSIIVNYLPSLITTFQNEIKGQPMVQLKLFSFMNRLLRKNMEKYIEKIVECYKVLIEIVPETILVNQLQFKKFNLDSMKVIASMIELSFHVMHIEFKDDLKRQILKGLRFHEFYLKSTPSVMNKLIDLLELNIDEDVGYFILLLGKQIENSKWKNITVFLQRISEIKFYQSQLQKMVANIIKIYSNCPYYMLQKLNEVIFKLLLVDRKGMEVYLKVRQRCLGSKNWMMRRNFIKLYTYFKINGSFELNKSITPLVYKNIVNEKNSLIKLQFIREFLEAQQQMKIFSAFLDPSLPQEKMSIKEVISRFSEDKDKELSQMAKYALQVMKNIDKDNQNIRDLMERNRELILQESLVEQVVSDGKKHIKTEKLIGKSVKEGRNSIKKGSLVETKTFAALSKMNHIDKSKQVPQSKPSLIRSNSSQNKKEVSRFFAPPTGKRSRF